jgi:hypothetical protein
MAHKQSYTAKLLLNEKKAQAGLVSERFPQVSGISMNIVFYQRLSSNPILLVRTINFFPTSYAYFDFDCMTENCSEGGFDLTPVISEMVKKHKKAAKGTIECKGKGSPAGHASISYEVKMEFNHNSK